MVVVSCASFGTAAWRCRPASLGWEHSVSVPRPGQRACFAPAGQQRRTLRPDSVPLVFARDTASPQTSRLRARRGRAEAGSGAAQVYVLAVMAAVMRIGEQDGEALGELLFLVPPYDSSKVFFPSYALKAAGKGARCAPGPKFGACHLGSSGMPCPSPID